MKTQKLSVILLVILTTLFNCEQTKTVNVDYKYTEERELYTCELADKELIKEAIYSFEADINKAYDKQNKGRATGYSSFIGLTIGNRIKIEEIASKHSFQIAKALQNSKHYKNNVFLYNSELANCMFDHIKNENTKKSFNALRSTNSLRPSVVLPTMRNNARNLITDKGLAGILAFDYYYNILMLLNEEQLKSPIEPANQSVDFNKTPKTPVKTIEKTTGHEGHNH